VNTDLDNQIRFVDYMLQGYQEPVGRKMLQAIRDSLERLKENSVRT
jgi:archaellum component FlaC